MSDISLLVLKNCQIKSAEHFKEVCHALDTLEKLSFIRSGRIRFTNVFICPDIDLIPLYKTDDPMQRLIAGLAIQLHVDRFGKNSRKEYRKIVKKKK